MAPSFATLRQFASTPRRSRVKTVSPPDQCALCSLGLPPQHRHLLEMETRAIACACDACAMLFQRADAGRFKLIPRDVRSLPDFQMTDAEWEDLALPIEMAFFFIGTPEKKIAALYPSPAGATESRLPLTAWETLVAVNPPLAALAPDVEALLVNRTRGARDTFIAPMDVCYELVGTLRLHWRGLHGGEEVWEKIDDFFARLKERGTPARRSPHA